MFDSSDEIEAAAKKALGEHVYQMVRLALATPVPKANLRAYVARMAHKGQIDAEVYERLIAEGILPEPNILRQRADEERAASLERHARWADQFQRETGMTPTSHPDEFADYVMLEELEGERNAVKSPDPRQAVAGLYGAIIHANVRSKKEFMVLLNQAFALDLITDEELMERCDVNRKTIEGWRKGRYGPRAIGRTAIYERIAARIIERCPEVMEQSHG